MKIEKINKFDLKKDEKIFFEFKPNFDSDDSLIVATVLTLFGIISSMITIIGFFLIPFFLFPYLALILIGSFIVIYLGPYHYNTTNRRKRAIFYLTNVRLIEKLGKGFSKKQKSNIFLLKNIDFFVDLDDGVWIFKKDKKKGPFYTGEETAHKGWSKSGNQFISLIGMKEIKQNLINKLIELIPAVKHNHLENMVITNI